MHLGLLHLLRSMLGQTHRPKVRQASTPRTKLLVFHPLAAPEAFLLRHVRVWLLWCGSMACVKAVGDLKDTCPDGWELTGSD